MTVASGLAAVSRAGTHALTRYRTEFPIFRDRIYLNSCSLGALGERAKRKVAEFLEVWQTRGAAAWYDTWWSALADLRAGYARVVGAAPGEIAGFSPLGGTLEPPPEFSCSVRLLPDGSRSLGEAGVVIPRGRDGAGASRIEGRYREFA